MQILKKLRLTLRFQDLEHIDDRLPALPPDMLAGLYARISTTEHNLAVDDLRIGPKYNQIPGYALGRVDAYPNIHELNGYYAPLGNPNIKESRRRAEAAVLHMVKGHRGLDYLSLLSVGVAAPLREAARTCQLGPPAVWPINAYELVGRNDLTEGALVNGDLIFDDGYRSVKEHIVRLLADIERISIIHTICRMDEFGERHSARYLTKLIKQYMAMAKP